MRAVGWSPNRPRYRWRRSRGAATAASRPVIGSRRSTPERGVLARSLIRPDLKPASPAHHGYRSAPASARKQVLPKSPAEGGQKVLQEAGKKEQPAADTRRLPAASPALPVAPPPVNLRAPHPPRAPAAAPWLIAPEARQSWRPAPAHHPSTKPTCCRARPTFTVSGGLDGVGGRNLKDSDQTPLPVRDPK